MAAEGEGLSTIGGANALRRTGLTMQYDMDDPRFRIRPYQQVVSSCTGALITSLTSRHNFFYTQFIYFITHLSPQCTDYLICCVAKRFSRIYSSYK